MEETERLKPTIRPFNKNDINYVLSIERRCFDGPWSPNMFEALYQLYPDGFYVAELDEYIVGYVIALFEHGSRFSSKIKTAHVLNLAVHPQFRNQGIARSLIDTVISNMIRAGAVEIYLEVRASNETAIAFYTKLDFKRMGLIKSFYGNEDAIVMAKDISQP